MKRTFSKPPRVALNLGGGAARGLAHVGALRAFEEARLDFDIIIGISMGAFVGSVYATVPDSNFVKERMHNWFNSGPVQESFVVSYNKERSVATRSVVQRIGALYSKTGALGRMLLSPGILGGDEIVRAFHPFIPPVSIENLRRPFACSAVNLENGHSRVFASGPLRNSVLASMAMPLVFPPVEIDEQLYCDGGVLDKIGLDAADELGVTHVVAIDVSNEDLGQSMINSGLDVMFRTEEIASLYRRIKQMRQASIVLKPIQGNIHWADYDSISEIIDMGYECVRDNMQLIRHSLRRPNPLRRFFSMFR